MVGQRGTLQQQDADRRHYLHLWRSAVNTVNNAVVDSRQWAVLKHGGETRSKTLTIQTMDVTKSYIGPPTDTV